jgi:hypothetical protein
MAWPCRFAVDIAGTIAYGDTIKLFSASNYSNAFGSIIPLRPAQG